MTPFGNRLAFFLHCFLVATACISCTEWSASEGDRPREPASETTPLKKGKAKAYKVWSKVGPGSRPVYLVGPDGELTEILNETMEYPSSVGKDGTESPNSQSDESVADFPTDLAEVKAALQNSPENWAKEEVSSELFSEELKKWSLKWALNELGERFGMKKAEPSGADPNYNPTTGAFEPPAPKGNRHPVPAIEFKPQVTTGDGPALTVPDSRSQPPKEIPTFLKACSTFSNASIIRQEFCQNTLDFIAAHLIEAHVEKKTTEIEQPYDVGTCRFDAALTLENGQIMGADSTAIASTSTSEKMSFISATVRGNTNAFNTKLITFKAILESATALCDGDTVLTSNIDPKTLEKLKENSFHITNTYKFSNFFRLLGPNTASPIDPQPNPTASSPVREAGR